MAAVNVAIRRLLLSMYAPMLRDYVGRGLLSDWRDLCFGVKVGIPLRAVAHVLDVTNCEYVHRTLKLFACRLDPTRPPEEPLRDGEPHAAVIARTLVHLEVDLAIFAQSYLIGGAPAKPATRAQRAAARKRRLADYKAVCLIRGYVVTDRDVYLAAKVQLTGRGGGPQWKDGRVPDKAKTSCKIEAVLANNSVRPSKRKD
jgi:hypothetical protein